jgi:hypothetical protein
MSSTPAGPRPLSRALSISERAYRRLLAAYPTEFRRRYGPEMAQVFRTACRLKYQASGVSGVARLWPATLWDWAWTVGHERLASLFRRSTMNATIPFDRQMGDLVWSLATGLFAGYSLPQVIEAISIEAPEPTASVFKRLHDDLEAGLSLDQALANLQKAVPSQHLGRVIAAIREQQKTGGNLGWLLVPLVDEILAQAPSDGSFYPAMRKEAEQLGALLPERAK